MAREATAPLSPAVQAPQPSELEQRRRLSTFHSLRYPNYRYLWYGQVGAAASNWMEQLARPLLIYFLTESPFMVGLIAGTRMLPMLLIGVWAGVIADRVDRRRILLFTKSIVLSVHAATAALILTGVIEPWMVFVTAFTAGSAMAFDQPARQSLIPRLVPDHALANAVALNSAAMQIMRVTGPAIAGLVLFVFDFGELYVLQALIYITVIHSTYRIKVEAKEPRRERTSLLSDLIEGFGAVRRDPAIFYILVLSLAIFVWGMPYNTVFVPLIGVEVLGIGEASGLLISCVGLGAVAGSLTIATYGDSVRRRGLIMLGLICTFAVALLALSRAETLLLAIPALIVSGVMQNGFMSLSNAFVLGRTPRELQGRVISLFSLDRGLVPLGALIGGSLAETLGPQDALAVMALICLSSTLLLACFVPSLRRLH